MRNPFVIFNKLIMKGIALAALSALSVFYCMLYVVFFCYRLLAVPFAAIGFVMTTVDCFTYGFTAERGLIFLFLLGMVTVRYMMPWMLSVLKDLQVSLTDYVYEPLFVRPPVRYTI